MKIKYVSGLWIVQLNYSQQIVFSHKNKNKCYEWMFKSVNYA